MRRLMCIHVGVLVIILLVGCTIATSHLPINQAPAQSRMETHTPTTPMIHPSVAPAPTAATATMTTSALPVVYFMDQFG